MSKSAIRSELRERLRKRQAERAAKRFYGYIIGIVATVLGITSYLDAHFGWRIITPGILLIVLGILILIGLLIYLMVRSSSE